MKEISGLCIGTENHLQWFRVKIELMSENAQQSVEAINIVTIDNQSKYSKEFESKLKGKIFKLQSQLVEGLHEIRTENPDVNLGGLLIFDLSEISKSGLVKTDIKISL